MYEKQIVWLLISVFFAVLSNSPHIKHSKYFMYIGIIIFIITFYTLL